jgi:hypothetical protein
MSEDPCRPVTTGYEFAAKQNIKIILVYFLYGILVSNPISKTEPDDPRLPLGENSFIH